MGTARVGDKSQIDWDAYWQRSGDGLFKSLLERVLHRTGFYSLLSRQSIAIGERLLRDCSVPTIVEVGSGTGTLAFGLGRIRTRRQLCLIDIAMSVLQRVKTGQAQLINADISSVPLRDGCCDLSCNIGTIEHFTDPVPIITEMRRISRAHVLCAVPAPSIIWTIATFVRTLTEQDASLWVENTRHYSRRQLAEMFAAAGIRDIRAEQQTFCGLPLMNIVHGHV